MPADTPGIVVNLWDQWRYDGGVACRDRFGVHAEAFDRDCRARPNTMGMRGMPLLEGGIGTNDERSARGRRLVSPHGPCRRTMAPDYHSRFQRDLHALAEKYRAKADSFLLGAIVTKDMKYFQGTEFIRPAQGRDRCKKPCRKPVQPLLGKKSPKHICRCSDRSAGHADQRRSG